MQAFEDKRLAALGIIAVTAAVLLVRLSQRAEKRKALREDAMRKLRESGEFFFSAIPT